MQSTTSVLLSCSAAGNVHSSLKQSALPHHAATYNNHATDPLLRSFTACSLQGCTKHVILSVSTATFDAGTT
jgi:hypothetical protein